MSKKEKVLKRLQEIEVEKEEIQKRLAKNPDIKNQELEQKLSFLTYEEHLLKKDIGIENSTDKTISSSKSDDKDGVAILFCVLSILSFIATIFGFFWCVFFFCFFAIVAKTISPKQPFVNVYFTIVIILTVIFFFFVYSVMQTCNNCGRLG